MVSYKYQRWEDPKIREKNIFISKALREKKRTTPTRNKKKKRKKPTEKRLKSGLVRGGRGVQGSSGGGGLQGWIAGKSTEGGGKKIRVRRNEQKAQDGVCSD